MSPFRSLSQIAKFKALLKQGNISQATYDSWLKETPNIKKLPKRVKKNGK